MHPSKRSTCSSCPTATWWPGAIRRLANPSPLRSGRSVRLAHVENLQVEVARTGSEILDVQDLRSEPALDERIEGGTELRSRGTEQEEDRRSSLFEKGDVRIG